MIHLEFLFVCVPNYASAIVHVGVSLFVCVGVPVCVPVVFPVGISVSISLSVSAPAVVPVVVTVGMPVVGVFSLVIQGGVLIVGGTV